MNVKNTATAIIALAFIGICLVFTFGAIVLYKAYQNPSGIGEYFGLIIKAFKSVQ